MEYINSLDERQRKAALHPPTPLIVYAGAGSGKTKLLTARIAHQIDSGDVKADKIFASTFTNAAAREMRERVEQLTDAPGLSIGTFHSLLFRFLNDERFSAGEESYIVCKTGERKRIFQSLLGPVSKDFPKALNVDADIASVMSQVSAWKANLIHHHDYRVRDTVETAPYGSDEWAAAKVYPLYEGVLTLQGKVDFDDMILKGHSLLSESPGALARARGRWSAFFIDEAQDTSFGQWAIIRLLADPGLEPNITVVGDTRQALYRFTSAIPELMDDFKASYPGSARIDLTANYRSREPITMSANELAKPLGLPDQVPARSTGALPTVVNCADEVDQAVQVVSLINSARSLGRKGGDVAVLIRTNAQSVALESAMVAAGLPYWCKGGGFFDRMEVGDLMAYLRLAMDHSDTDSLMRIINRPTRFLGGAFVEAVEREAMRSDGDLVSAMRRVDSYGTRKLFFKQRESAFKLAELIDSLSPSHGVEVSPRFALEKILLETEYMDWLKKNSGIGGGVDDSKQENIDRLISEARGYGDISSLIGFADETTKLQVDDGDSTEICTVHASKGREWPIVVATNFQDGSIPHARALQGGVISDERRIAYVAMTRAEEYLTIMIPRASSLNGDAQAPSRFLADVDPSRYQELNTGDGIDWGAELGLVKFATL